MSVKRMKETWQFHATSHTFRWTEVLAKRQADQGHFIQITQSLMA